MTSRTVLNRSLSRRKVLQTAGIAAAIVGAPGILRAQTKEIVVGCAASHTGWMKDIVAPAFEKKHKAKILVEGTKSLVNLEKMQSNKAKPYLSVVQMDDPVMILAVEQGLLEPITAATVPNLANLRKGAVHMDGMWANYVQPWAGIAYNKDKMPKGVASWATMWEPALKGKVIMPSLQNTEGMCRRSSMAAALATGKPLEAAQYEIDAAFKKLAALKPNLLSVYYADAAGVQSARAGRDLAARAATGRRTRCRARRKARRSIWRRPRKVSSRCRRASASSRAARTRIWRSPTSTRCSAPELQAKLADDTFALPANTTVKAGARPCRKACRCSVRIGRSSSKNRKDWIERFDKLMAV